MGVELQVHAFKPRDLLGFDISRLESICDKAIFSTPHRHSFYEILFVTGGVGLHYIDLVQYVVRPPCMYLLAPGQVHHWKDEKDVRGIAIIFRDEFLYGTSDASALAADLDFFHHQASNSIALGPKSSTSVMALGERMMKEFQDPGILYESLLRASLQILTIEMKRECEALESREASRSAQDMALKFRRLVMENVDKNLSVSAIARMLSISSGRLREVVRLATGMSPGDIFRRAKILEAKRLLTYTNMSIAEVGYTLSFKDPAYFARFFKRETELSPGRFRFVSRPKYLNSRQA